jgi:hypothetical protein
MKLINTIKENDPAMIQNRLRCIFYMVTPRGFEPLIAGMRTQSPGPLDDGATGADLRLQNHTITEVL